MVQPTDVRLMTEATFYEKAHEQDTVLDQYLDRIRAVETLGGLAPGAVSDATMASFGANPLSDFTRAMLARYVPRDVAPVDVLQFGAVADDTGDGAGTDNSAAFQRACNEAVARGSYHVLVPAPKVAGRFYTLGAGATSTEGATLGYAVKVPAGVKITFEKGARVYAKNLNKAQARTIFLLERAHGAQIVDLDVVGSVTSHSTGDNLVAVKIYRSKFVRIIRPQFDKVGQGLLTLGNPAAGQADNTTNLHLEKVRIGPLTGSGPHFFGAHESTRLYGLLVEGTLVYDALQLEGPGAETASVDFYGEDIDVRSCAARGIYINPNNSTPHLKKVRVRNPGRLADGTIIGYDQNVPANATSNSCITVFGSGAVLEDVDVSGGLNITPANQPKVTWSSEGYGIVLNGTHRVEFRGYTRFGTNDGGDVFINNPTGYDKRQTVTTFQRPDRQPRIVYGTSGTLPAPVVTNASPTRETRNKLVSLLPAANTAGPDGTFAPWFTPVSGSTAQVIPSDGVFPSKLRVTGTTGSFAGASAQLPSTVQLAKNGVIHLLMVARLHAPAPQFSWALGGNNAKRVAFTEGNETRDYQPGVRRFIHSTQRYAATDTIPNYLQLWWNYGSAAAALDIEVEAMWLYVGEDPFADAPVFDYSAPLVSAGPPTLGTWTRGQVVLNGSPAAGGRLGWVCTATGTPGTWKGYGPIDA